MRRCVMIINPTAGSYSPAMVERARRRMEDAGCSVDVLLTRNEADAADFAANESGRAGVIVAGGGDGTVNGVLNGLAGSSCALAVLPLGTSNVLARELGIRNIDDALEKICRGDVKPASAGLIEWENGQRRYFLLMAGVGFDGGVTETVRKSEKKVLGTGAYFLAGIRLLAGWDRSTLRVSAGGEEVECHSAVVCNASRYGGKFLLAPRAELASPDFEVVCLCEPSRRSYLQLLLRLSCGFSPEGAGIRVLRGSRVEVHGEKPVQADGDYLGRSPLTVRCLPGFVRLVV